MNKKEIIQLAKRFKSTDSIKEKASIEAELVKFGNEQIELRNEIHKKYHMRPLFGLMFADLKFDGYYPETNVISFTYDIDCPYIHIELDKTLEEYEAEIRQESIGNHNLKIKWAEEDIKKWKKFIEDIS
jgi:hypothetical protein